MKGLVNVPRCIAGVFVGAGSLFLIYKGHIQEGTILLTTMLAFFIGEANGARKASKEDS